MLICVLPFLVSAVSAALVPGPPGPLQVAYNEHTITDESRLDPFAPPSNPHKRRIIASTYLPLEPESCTVETIPYMLPQSTVAYGLYVNSFGLPLDLFEGLKLEFCKLPEECGPTQKYPLAILSPGLTVSRFLVGAQARALASYGFAVITIDHPYDATFVEFPDGTAINGTLSPSMNDTLAAKAVEVRVQDVSFVLDRLQPGYGTDSDSFSEAFASSVDLDQVIVFGHSLGGATAASVAFSDDRVLGGVNLDGGLYGPVIESGLDKPFLLTSQSLEQDTRPPWIPFYANARGPKMMMGINGTLHNSFIDLKLVLTTRDIPEEMVGPVEAVLGTIDARRMEEIILCILRGFLDLTLHENAEGLLGIEDTFSEITIVEEDLI